VFETVHDTSDLRHFGLEAFPHWCQNVQWTLRHHRENPTHFGTSLWHFGTIILCIQKCHINLFIYKRLLYDTYFGTFLYYITEAFFVQGMQHRTELAWPLLYHGDTNANSFIEANSFLFCRIAYH